MSLIGLIILLVIVGLILYFVPMDAGIKKIIVGVVAIVVIVALLQAFGLFHFADIKIGR